MSAVDTLRRLRDGATRVQDSIDATRDAVVGRWGIRRGPRPAPGSVPPRALRPLLDVITEQSLDADYALAARRRAAMDRDRGRDGDRDRDRTGRRQPRLAAGIAVVLVALLATTAVLQTRRNAPVADEGRASLLSRIGDQKQILDRLQARQLRLTSDTTARQRAVTTLTDTLTATQADLRDLQIDNGFADVHGPGVRFTVRSAPDADLNQAVRDTDLTLVAGGLFAAGAEAVAINGTRLTTLSGIHLSGTALYVGDQGVAPPYIVSAIGDQRTLEARFYDTEAGLEFSAVARAEGFSVDVENVGDMSFEARPTREETLRHATALAGSPGPAGPGGPGGSGGSGGTGGTDRGSGGGS